MYDVLDFPDLLARGRALVGLGMVDPMTPEEYRTIAYRLGHGFAQKQLRAGDGPDSVRLAMQRAQEHLLVLRAYSAELDRMMRRGVEDALAGKPMDRRCAAPGPP